MDTTSKRRAYVKHPFKQDMEKTKYIATSEQKDTNRLMREFDKNVEDIINNPLIKPKKIERR
jgi:hypothetical protein